MARDRRYAFVRRGANSGFPWFTRRDLSQLLLYTPQFVEPHDPGRSSIVVTTPGGNDLPLESPELVEELQQACGESIFLLKLGRSTYDSQVLSLMSTASISALGEKAGMTLEVNRFRQNIIIETPDGRPFQEDGWLDHEIIFGHDPDGPRVRLIRRINRCVMINIQPDTADRDSRVLKTVAQSRDNFAGTYASVERPGNIRVGDPVYVRAKAI